MNPKVIRTFIVLAVLCLVYFLFEKEIMNIIKTFFEHNIFFISHTLIVTGVFIAHFMHKIETTTELKMLHSEHAFFDMVLNIGTFTIIGSTAFALLKGVYLQEFFDVEYFKGYGKIDIWTICAVSCSLLWYTSTRIVGLIKEALFYKPQEIEKDS